MNRLLLALVCVLTITAYNVAHTQDTRAIYLSPWVASATRADLSVPYGLDQAGAGCIDLRSDASVRTGYAICAAPVLPPNAGVIQIGASLSSALSGARKTAVQTALGITINAATVGDFLPELLITHARTNGTRWRPLRPARDGKLHIWLGGPVEVWKQTAWLWPYVEDNGLVADASNAMLKTIEPALAWATSLAEDFNCGDNASLTCDLTWTEFQGTAWEIISNAARVADKASPHEARADSDLATDDHEVWGTVSTLSFNSGFNECGVIARKDSAATRSFYYYNAEISTGPDNHFYMGKRVAGAASQLGSTDTTDWVSGDVLKIRVDGDQISGYRNGVLSVGPVTDSSIASNTRGGVIFNSNDASHDCVLDNWAAADYSLASIGQFRRRAQ